MIQEEWGQKHLCQSCGALFYDMQGVVDIESRVINCPNCGKPHNALMALKLLPTQYRQEHSQGEEKDGTEFGVEEDIIPEDTADLDDSEDDVELPPEEKESE